MTETIGDIIGDPVTVEINKRVFTIHPISLREERLVYGRWEELARKQITARRAQAYEVISAAPTQELRIAGMQELVRHTLQGDTVTPAMIQEAYRSPEGIALNLHARTRATHADVSLDDIRALITPVNARECHDALEDAIEKISKNTLARSA